MGNERGTVQQMPVYVCRTAGCFWEGRDRIAAISRERINIGQGLFLQAAVVCECGGRLDDQGGPSQ